MKDLLIIDDDEDIRVIVKIILESSGHYAVREAASASAGITALYQASPDILLLDHLLPEVSGLDLLKKMGSSLRQTDVVVLTARQDPELEAEFMAAGARGVLYKPFDPDLLITGLEELLDIG
jgi:DNA-binding NtrC family response regulator